MVFPAEKSNKVQYDAHDKITAKEFFAESQDNLNQDSNAVDLELLQKINELSFWDKDCEL